MKLSYVIPDDFSGTVADFFAQKGFSTTQIKRFKFGGSILVNGTPATVRKKLFAGDRLDLSSCEKSPPLAPSDVKADVLFADEYLYVAVKPYGIAVHPDRAHKTDTLGNRLAASFGEDFRLHVVTRLDKLLAVWCSARWTKLRQNCLPTLFNAGKSTKNILPKFKAN